MITDPIKIPSRKQIARFVADLDELIICLSGLRDEIASLNKSLATKERRRHLRTHLHSIRTYANILGHSAAIASLRKDDHD